MSDLIVRRPPYCQSDGTQRLVNHGYLSLARLAARLLARSPLVRSVFLRRSIAAGEAGFPWSDIDLTLILHQHCAGPAQLGPLLDLNRKVRRLRRAFPLVGQIETFTAEELPAWFLLEPARESYNRRAAILLAGEPLSIPAIPIPPENAAYRCCFYLEDYITRAVMTRNSRNLRKFALDMWSNASVARGLSAEPHITRREAAQAWGPGAPRPNDQVEAIVAALFDTAAVLHGEMLPPLQEIEAPMQADVVLPPSLATRRIVLVPSNRPGESLSISHPSAIIFTPEALHLYIRFTNPFLFDLLPPHFIDLGFQRPPVSSYQFAINRWRCGILARKPGFGQAGLGVGPRTIVYANHAAARLAESRYPLSITAQQLGPLAAGQHTVDDYFRNLYAEAYSLCR